MPALLTDRDRKIYRLQRAIEQQERNICAEMGDTRAVAFRRAKLTELRTELEELEEKD